MTSPLLLGACLALGAQCAAAQTSAVTIYGRLNAALEKVDTSRDASGKPLGLTRESNYRSVIGFRGSEALGNGLGDGLGDDLRAIYQVEGTLSLDSGAGSIAARDTRIGLEGAFGVLFAGNWVTPYNAATSGLDPFYPTTAGYMSIMGNGSASTADNVSDTASFDRRQQNSIHYASPAWRGWSLRVAHGLNEESPAGGARPSLSSGAIVYEAGALYFALAQERHHAYQGMGRTDTGSKVALAWRIGTSGGGATRVAAVAEQLRYQTASGALERSAVYLSATHQIGAHGIRVAAARAGDGKGPSTERIGFIKSGAATGATHYTLGYDYKLSERSSLFAYYTRLRNGGNGVADFAINSMGVAAGARLSGAALGMRHAF